MSNVMSVDVAGADKLTMKVAGVVPLLPSVTVTSLIVKPGGVPAMQLFNGELLLRGKGAETSKSAALSLVSTQPPALRKSAVVLLGPDAGPDPS